MRKIQAAQIWTRACRVVEDRSNATACARWRLYDSGKRMRPSDWARRGLDKTGETIDVATTVVCGPRIVVCRLTVAGGAGLDWTGPGWMGIGILEGWDGMDGWMGWSKAG